MSPSLCIVAGEASGDAHAGALLAALQQKDPSLETFGIGGDLMQVHGFDALYHVKDMGVVGFFEIVKKLPFLYRAFYGILDAVAHRKPSAIVLVDYPDFNMRLGRKLHKRHPEIPIIYFISPQVWAWRKGRVKQIQAFVRKMLVIFPFEEDFYHKAGVDALYVGHPMAGDFHPLGREESFKRLGLDVSKKCLLFLPGSRESEVSRHLPPLWDAAKRILSTNPQTQILISEAPTLPKNYVTARIPPNLRGKITLSREPMETLLGAADAAIVSSGTSTFQTALAEVPMAVIYKLSGASYFIARAFVSVEHIAMVNILLDKKCVAELLQDACSGEAIAKEAMSLLDDDAKAAAIKSSLSTLREKLGEKNAADEAADAILGVIGYESKNS